MQFMSPYLFFDGNCAEAMRFYERALGGTMEAIVKVSEMPAAAGADYGSPDLIMHACLKVGNDRLMASDRMGPGSSPYPGMQGFSVSMNFADIAQAQRTFNALADGGKIILPFGKTSWSEGFGMLTDRFGAQWMVNTNAELGK